MKKRRIITILAFLLIALGLLAVTSCNNFGTSANRQRGLTELHFIDVGQGDSIFIRLPNGRTMLVDAGTKNAEQTVTRYIKSKKVSRIDILIATHPHEDHIGAMTGVINEFEIGSIYMPKVSANTKTFESPLGAIKSKGLSVNSAKGGMVLSDSGDFKTEFLAPNGNSYNELNDYSAVLKITHGSTSFLLTGDAEKTSEDEMIRGGYNLSADVLKVGHHGSHTSSSPEFLSAVSPQIAVISCGRDNSYGHPAENTLLALADIKAEVYRTDEKGTIVITSDGKNIKVR
ncbi:MAG: ComEC family competence protein [Firmicutes bacterium ADurb.Bin193]|nr:MAG: ComEC family competence protein [Firmicutes bacterium ADurb.Bin193]